MARHISASTNSGTRTRRTLRMSPASSRIAFVLDPEAVLSVNYGLTWHRDAQRTSPNERHTMAVLDVPAAAVVRRALAAYMERLDSLTTAEERAAEFDELARVCDRRAPTPANLERIEAAIQAAMEDTSPLPPLFTDLMLGSTQAERIAEHEAREARMNAALPARYRYAPGVDL